MNIKLWQSVADKFRSSDIDGAIRFLEELLVVEKGDRFKKLIGRSFTNSSVGIFNEIERFINSCGKLFEVKSIYLEMNGFGINYDRWYFDFFAYNIYDTDTDSLDWLSDWKSTDWPEVELVGLEEVQKDFEWYHSNQIWENKEYEACYEVAELLVMCKYASLIKNATQTGKSINKIPVLATAHDFDIIARFE